MFEDFTWDDSDLPDPDDDYTDAYLDEEDEPIPEEYPHWWEY